jgi:hypothetical protein
MSGRKRAVAFPAADAYPGMVTVRACLRLLLFAALLLAPLGRIGIAQAMAAPSATGMTMAHCAGMPAPAPGHHQKAPGPQGERMAVDCMIACAAMTTAPAPCVTPPPAAVALPTVAIQSSLSGIQPEADPPPPRFS